MAVVATAEVQVYLNNKPALSTDEINERAFRTCSLGFPFCKHAGTIVDVREDGTGIADVQMLCSAPEICRANDDSLGAGMGRLAASAALREKNKTPSS